VWTLVDYGIDSPEFDISLGNFSSLLENVNLSYINNFYPGHHWPGDQSEASCPIHASWWKYGWQFANGHVQYESTHEICQRGMNLGDALESFFTYWRDWAAANTDVENYEEFFGPEEFSLSQNYPNPFNATCELAYTLPTGCHVTLSIYNIIGQRMRVLVDKYQSAGRKFMRWDGKDDKGEDVASGIYFYRLQAGDFVQAKKMLLLR